MADGDAPTSPTFNSRQHQMFPVLTREEIERIGRFGTRQRYERGLASYLDVLGNEENVLQARRSVADLQARVFTLDVQMVRSLGGGFTKA